MADPPNATTRPQDLPDELAHVHPAHLFQLLFVEADEPEEADVQQPTGTVPAALAELRMRHLLSAQGPMRTASPDRTAEE